ncbi:PaaX family transcriptional regulator C-terminal domain-containing protein [Actinomadura sp. 9N407]|uniref:PaaX family transcriptional regulator n=1 Tax=Actinomadura sp. 9N407 TaxID=3375154 RepID=UPI0037966AA1
MTSPEAAGAGTGDGRGSVQEDVQGQVSLPRTQSGSQPQNLLMTLLGDYWHGRTEHVPSAALVALLEEFGISPFAARAALSRLTRRGVLESSRTGRRTHYRLSTQPSAAAALDQGMRRITSFATASRPWDGTWRVVIFSVPEERRDVRHAARGRLRWLGFAPLYDGVWICPHDREAEAVGALASLGVRQYTSMTAQVPPSSPQGLAPIEAWDLARLRARYDEFVTTWEAMLERVRGGALREDEALPVRTELMYSWLYFPSLDPELPAELLPADWPRARAYEVFAELYDALGPLAESRVRGIIARFAPELAPLVRYHPHQGP